MNCPGEIKSLIQPFSGSVKILFRWEPTAGERGAYIASINAGRFEAIAEPTATGWRCWIVDKENGETVASGDINRKP